MFLLLWKDTYLLQLTVLFSKSGSAFNRSLLIPSDFGTVAGLTMTVARFFNWGTRYAVAGAQYSLATLARVVA